MANTYDEVFFHNIVWKRFIRMPYGHLLDYAGKNGEALFPTAEECQKAMPNPRSWGLPIENGAFFTGLYTYALLEKYTKTKCEKTAKDIEILINGLLLLQDVGNVEGFIARGVADDGRSHYPMSAECQMIPWILALYSYSKSDLCKDKDSVRKRILTVLNALRNNEWRVPCDVKGVCYKESWFDADDWRGVTMVVFCSRLIYELTGNKDDLLLFETMINSNPNGSVFSRKEIISQGFCHDMLTSLGKGQTWICTYTHLAVKELLKLDEKNRDRYRSCLYNNGVTALKSMDGIAKYDNSPDGFDIDWRPLNALWEDYHNDPDNGTRIANREFAYWHKEFVPHRIMEHQTLGNALFSAWVAVSCGDKRISKRAFEKLKDSVSGVDWDNLHLSYAFVVECAFCAAQ